MNSYIRKTCRLCLGNDLVLAVPIKDSPVGDAFITKENLLIPQPSYSLNLYLCQTCAHVQLLTVVNPKILFGDYIYRTSTSYELVQHFKNYANEVINLIQPEGRLAVEIGSNDGTFLKFLKEKKMHVLGVDPANTIAAEATKEGVETWPTFFSQEVSKQIKEKNGETEIIVANNVFAHADDMIDVLRGIYHLLSPEGIFVFEVSYLLDIIQKKLFDTVFHEHLSYYSVLSLENFFNSHEMQLFDVQRISSKGGSLRGFAKKKTSSRVVSPIVSKLIDDEKNIGLNKIKIFKDFSDDLNRIEKALKKQLDKLKEKDKTLVGYGASPTVTTFMYQFELGPYLEFIVDDNPIKQGRHSPGYHIPILPSSMLYQKKPDYVIILAWQYWEVIIEKNKKYLEQGGKFIVPFPELIVHEFHEATI
ncbi:MAG: hypothetical protein ACD_44C00139G0003 [uncultured bacterium]|nr:MAG: hypothetical protein ACD_44C00139G0003 [uncultured bacterium]OGT23243.1 MAG: hypothetical protein A2W47_06055 [Gammaproteobacteria bacterium RIFCSPHIGHO2_12_38_15]